MPRQVYDGIVPLHDIPGPCATRMPAVGAVDRQRSPTLLAAAEAVAPEDRAIVILEVCDYHERGHDESAVAVAPDERRRISASRPARVTGLLVAITCPFLKQQALIARQACARRQARGRGLAPSLRAASGHRSRRRLAARRRLRRSEGSAGLMAKCGILEENAPVGSGRIGLRSWRRVRSGL